MAYYYIVTSCQRQDCALLAVTLVQLNLPHSVATSAPDDVTLAAIPVKPNMPHSVAVRASKLPKTST